MPTVKNENEMASKAVEPDEPDDGESKPVVPYAGPATPGFFTIYKRGQGKWTRLGTAAVALLLGVLTAFSLYQNIIPYLPVSTDTQHNRMVQEILLTSCVAFLVLFCIWAFHLSNKPRNVDFLIATDSEMKKVNWTTGGQLIGSTRVVILFIFCIAMFLAAMDLIFYELFHLCRVLQ